MISSGGTPSPLAQLLASHVHAIRTDSWQRLCRTISTSAGYVRISVQVDCVMSSPAPSPAGSATVIAAMQLPVVGAEGSGPQPTAPGASAGATAPQAPPPPPPLRFQVRGEEAGIVLRPSITVVTTVEELVRATEDRAQDIEIRAHLDLRTLDGRPSGHVGQTESKLPLERNILSPSPSLLVTAKPTRSIRACSPFLYPSGVFFAKHRLFAVLGQQTVRPGRVPATPSCQSQVKLNEHFGPSCQAHTASYINTCAHSHRMLACKHLGQNNRQLDHGLGPCLRFSRHDAPAEMGQFAM